MANHDSIFKNLIAHCKEYGYVFQSSEIYEGISAIYDYGPNGVELKNNIIRGAAIDVFVEEPINNNNPLLQSKNIFFT